MTDLEYSDIETHVEDYHALEVADTTTWHAQYLRLGNQALMEIAAITKGLADSWSTAVGGGLTLVGNTITLPNDVVKVDSVWCDGLELEFADECVLNREDYAWRTNSGTPTRYTKTGNSIVLNTTGAGVITVYGIGILPTFPANDDWVITTTYAINALVTYNWKVYKSLQGTNLGKNPATETTWWAYQEDCPNPLASIPAAYQLLPAYFILWRLPASPETAIETQRKLENKGYWEGGTARLADAYRARGNEPYNWD